MPKYPFCDERVTRLVREVGWWDHYLVCEKHVAWARSQFPKGMRLYERKYDVTGYREIATGCVAPKDGGSGSRRPRFPDPSRRKPSGSDTEAATSPPTHDNPPPSGRP